MNNKRPPGAFRLSPGKHPLQGEKPQHGTSKHAKIIREMIRHEDDVMDQRFTWLCQIQGFLFAALALAWKEPTPLVLVLCFVGITVAISSWLSLRSVQQGVSILLDWWDKNKPSDYSGVPYVFARQSKEGVTIYFRPWNLLPLIFCLAWLIVFAIKWGIFDP